MPVIGWCDKTPEWWARRARLMREYTVYYLTKGKNRLNAEAAAWNKLARLGY